MESRFLVMYDAALRKEFGARLKALRKQKNWPQKELAAKVEIRFQQLNKYESGLNVPPAGMLVRLAHALDVSVDYLLTGNPMEDSPLANLRLFKRFQVLEHLNQDDQDTVIKIIDAMIAKGRSEAVLIPIA